MESFLELGIMRSWRLSAFVSSGNTEEILATEVCWNQVWRKRRLTGDIEHPYFRLWRYKSFSRSDRQALAPSRFASTPGQICDKFGATFESC